MRAAVLVLLIFSVVMLAGAFVHQPWQRPGQPTGTFPTFPGHGPFNPRPRWPEAYGRGRRSAAYVDDTLQGDQGLDFEADPRLAFE